MSEVQDGLPESKRGTAETYETPDPRTHYTELDALRGIAITGVVMTHLASFWFIGTRQQLEVPFLQINLLSYFNLGYLGVSLFFLLSGYLLTWTEEKRARRGSYSLLSYAKRRALRLAPAYYVAIVLVVVLWPTRPSLGDVALLFTFLHGFRPQFPVGLDPAVWSLTPEVAFYAMLPFLVLKLRSLPQRLAVFGILVTVSVVTRFLMEYGVFDSPRLFDGTLADNRMYFYPTTLLYLFIAGMLLRMMVERLETGRIPDGWQHTAALISTVVPVAVLVAIPSLVRRQDLLGSPLAFVAEGMVILFFAAALLGSPILKSLLNWRPLVSLGKISYSLFLLHMTVIYLTIRYVLLENRSWFAEQSEPVLWAAFVAYAIFVLAVATGLSYLKPH